MRRVEFAPCLPTRGTAVPARPDWIHEIKHDGYRLTVHREGKRVRLFTRNGHDWSDRYPLIVEAAHRIGTDNRKATGQQSSRNILECISGVAQTREAANRVVSPTLLGHADRS
jgi:hypothetical protein